jgi:hypothetical protein
MTQASFQIRGRCTSVRDLQIPHNVRITGDAEQRRVLEGVTHRAQREDVRRGPLPAGTASLKMMQMVPAPTTHATDPPVAALDVRPTEPFLFRKGAFLLDAVCHARSAFIEVEDAVVDARHATPRRRC